MIWTNPVATFSLLTWSETNSCLQFYPLSFRPTTVSSSLFHPLPPNWRRPKGRGYFPKLQNAEGADKKTQLILKVSFVGDDFVEHPIPEQFKTRLVGGKLETLPTESA
jgi:hypothetical protein